MHILSVAKTSRTSLCNVHQIVLLYTVVDLFVAALAVRRFVARHELAKLTELHYTVYHTVSRMWQNASLHAEIYIFHLDLRPHYG